jgi:acetyl-CoA carboxylase carboxyltransferase component
MTVVLRKAYGDAFITMNSRELGADLLLAWPRAQLGVAEEGVIDEIVAPSDTRSRLASALRTYSHPARPVRPARNIPL